MPRRPPIHNPLSPAMQARLSQQKAAEGERKRKQYEQGDERKADRAFYSSTRWKNFRLYLMTSKPDVYALCAECKKEGRLVPANQLDHILPRKTHPELSFEESNLQGLCRRHHAAKTLRGE